MQLFHGVRLYRGIESDRFTFVPFSRYTERRQYSKLIETLEDTRMKQAWFVGECMLELRPVSPALLAHAFAGDVYNTAVYFRRFGPPCQCVFVSCVGTDSLSDDLLRDATRHGLDTRGIARIEGSQPGLYWIETDASGERRFLYWRAQSAARAMLDETHFAHLQADLPSCLLLYFSGISLAILDEARRERLLHLARGVRDSGGIVAFDSNYRPLLWESADAARMWTTSAVQISSHVLVTDDDEARLHGDASALETLSRILSSGVREVVVKMGKDGCLVQGQDMATHATVPAVPAKVTDTTAAGDSFNAAYLATRISGGAAEDAARAGAALAARVVGYPGAIIESERSSGSGSQP